MKRKVFLLADGEPLSRGLRSRLRRGRESLVLDGAAQLARRERWDPDWILGDFDSVSAATLRHFARKGVPIFHRPDQEHTDLEKGLTWCRNIGCTDIWVAGALGDRLDHSLANLSYLKKFYRREQELLFFTEREVIRFVKNSAVELIGPVGRGFAVLPFPACKVTSRGLAFEMKNTPLRLGKKESVSNRAIRQRVKLKIQGEALVIEGTK